MNVEKIETERLIFRKPKMEDAEMLFKNEASREKVAVFMPWKRHESVKDTEKFLKEALEKFGKSENHYVVEIKESKKVIGTISSTIAFNQDIKVSTLGCALSDDYWGKGFASEMVKKFVQYLFEEEDVDRIQARYNTKNTKSGRALEKAGMKFEGVARCFGSDNSQHGADFGIYALTKKDYFADKGEEK